MRISHATLFNWLSGKTQPSQHDAEKAAKGLGIPPEEFWTPDDPADEALKVRLAKLEGFVGRVQELLVELDAERGGKRTPIPDAPRVPLHPTSHRGGRKRA